jgi:hypothetical protein
MMWGKTMQQQTLQNTQTENIIIMVNGSQQSLIMV